jgi:hypothetical protein
MNGSVPATPPSPISAKTFLETVPLLDQRDVHVSMELRVQGGSSLRRGGAKLSNDYTSAILSLLTNHTQPPGGTPWDSPNFAR